MLLERGVIRFLYGRPLETLLATWGISLGLIQTVRLIFGAQNVAVANPTGSSGGVEIAHGLVLPYSRIGVVGFVVVVAAARLVPAAAHAPRPAGARGDAEPRAWRRASGIRTAARRHAGRSASARASPGLGGVALSQLGNVGPELGQSYIVDSFMVVVLGGVGRLAGTVAAALGLGVVNKLLEPVAGAVLGKIVVLVFIILFIQRRPAGAVRAQGPGGGLSVLRSRLLRDALAARLADPAASPRSSACCPGAERCCRRLGAALPDYLVPLLGKFLCFGIAALAMDLVWGYAGILSLGHGAVLRARRLRAWACT